MIDDKNLQTGEAVGDPLATAHAETSGTAEPLEHANGNREESTVSSAGLAESAPLGAYRRARLNPVVDESQLQAIPSLPRTNSSPNEKEGEPSGETIRTTAESGSPVATRDGEVEAAATGVHEAEESTASLVTTSQIEQFEPPRRPAAHVAIPPRVEDLGSDLDAQIEAARAQADLELAAAAAASVHPDTEDTAHVDKPPEEQLGPGQHLTGRIQSINGDDVFLELGYRSPGVVSLRQFVSGKKPEIGQQIEVVVDHISEELIHVNLPKGLRRIAGNWESLAKGQIVDCIVNRTNKGGLEVTVSGLRGFLPSSQIELGFVSDLDPYVGQKLRVEVMEVNKRKRNLVVSRRACLQAERQEAEGEFWKTLDVGQTYTGRVKTIKDYGVFVDLGSVDGFLHIGEMTWHRIKHPAEVVKEGQTIDVKVLSLDREKKKIGLGMKQLAQNPWTTAADRYPVSSTITGKVTRIADFGAFVELEPGLDGLIHVSELDHKHVRHPSDVIKVHEVVTAQVLEVDAERKRVSLSRKALLAKPEEPKREAEPPEPEAVVRKRKNPLKGGTGSSVSGGLFGNPSDYRR